MTGSEAVIVTMLTPKGVSLMQALAYKQAEGVYEAEVTSLEVSCSPSNAIDEESEHSLQPCATGQALADPSSCLQAIRLLHVEKTSWQRLKGDTPHRWVSTS